MQHWRTLAPATPSRTHRWITPALCLLFAGALLLQETLLLLQITPETQSMVSWPWRMLAPLVAIAVALLLPWRSRWLGLGAAGGSLSIAMAADATYYSFFQSVTSLRAAVSLHQLWDVRDSVVALVEPLQLAFLLVFVALIGFGLFSRAPRPEPSRWWAERLCAVGLLVLAFGLWHLAWRTPVIEQTHHMHQDAERLPAEHWGARFSPVRFAATFGVLNYHVRDLAKWGAGLLERPEPLAPERLEQIRALLAHKQELNATPSALQGIAAGRHVLIVQLESWQHFLLDLRIDGVEVTPNFNALAREGLRYDSIMDVTHHGRTADAEFAVLTGLLPDIRKPAAFHHLGSVALALPRSLKALGYRTASMHGYDRAFWNRAYTHPEWGIDEMYFEESFANDEQLGLGASDRAVFHFVAKYLLESGDRPVFAFTISLSSHHPYIYTPPEYAQLFQQMDPEQGYGLIGAYLRAARYSDDALGELIAEMKRLGLHDKTLYAIYGDHDMGGLGIQRPLPELVEDYRSPASDRVPLLILVPGQERLLAAQREALRPSVGGLHDVFPTVLHLLGQPIPFGIDGTHLLVPADARDPLPIVGPPDAYAWRDVLYGPGGTLSINGIAKPSADAPGPQGPVLERALLEDMLDQRLQKELLRAHAQAAPAGAESLPAAPRE